MNSTFGYFGKLPAYGDFIKSNAGVPEIAALDNWIQEGMYAARVRWNDWKEKYRSFENFNFILPAGTRIILGAIFKSYDKSSREYPFVVFNNYERNSLTEAQYFLPLIYKEECNFISGNVSDRINNNQSFLPETKLDEVLLQRIEYDFQIFLRKSQTILWTALFGDPCDELKYEFFRKILNLDENINYHSKIPFPGNISKEFYISFFIQLIGRVKHKNNTRSALFWNQNDDFFISADGIKNFNFLNLLLPESSAADLLIPEENTTSDSFIYKQMLDDNELTLKDLINNL